MIAAPDRDFLKGAGRAAGGALIFALPLTMTMEMWSLGFSMDPLRLLLLLLLLPPLLLGLSRYGGFRRTVRLRDELADIFVAIAIATIGAAAVLALFGLLNREMAAEEIIGKIALQIVPASIGAMLARNQFGSHADEEDGVERPMSYWGELFLMAVGALFLSLNVAPTEEVTLIAYTMNAWQELILIVLSVALMHGFVFAVDFSGHHPRQQGVTFLSAFARFTMAGYGIVLVVSLFLLWCFGRTDGTSLQEIVSATVVLSFPGAIGAAAARLIL